MKNKNMSRPLKVLVVCSYNSGKLSPFVREQVNSLRNSSVSVDYYKVVGKGVLGYLKNYKKLKQQIRANEYDLIHAHYGLCGLLANLQRSVPVITTFHGSDIHYLKNRMFSFVCSRLSAYNILTNKKQIELLKLSNSYSIVPCGVDLSEFYPMNKTEYRNKFNLDPSKQYILFGSSFDRKVKNYNLAKSATAKLKNVELLELKGYTKREVAALMNAVDAVLVTSFKETGPLIVKEALACNTPVVSTDVGDVKDLIQNVDNCYLTNYSPDDIAEKLATVIKNNQKGVRCNGRNTVEKYELQATAKKVKIAYSGVTQ